MHRNRFRWSCFWGTLLALLVSGLTRAEAQEKAEQQVQLRAAAPPSGPSPTVSPRNAPTRSGESKLEQILQKLEQIEKKLDALEKRQVRSKPWLPTLSLFHADPPPRIKQMLVESEALQKVQEEWERIWFTDHPSHLTPFRTDGTVAPSPVSEKQTQGAGEEGERCKKSEKQKSGIDVESLNTLIRQVVPTAKVVVIPTPNNAIILTGSVTRAEDVNIIRKIVQSVGGVQVIDAMRVEEKPPTPGKNKEGRSPQAVIGGALGTLVGAAAGRPLEGAAIGTGIGGPIGGVNGAAQEIHDRQGTPGRKAAQQRGYEELSEVAKMHQVGVSDAVIIQHVLTSGAIFNLTADQIVWLKQQGISEAIIQVMNTTRHKSSTP